MKRSHELSGKSWKVFCAFCDHRNIVTGQCNPSHKVIARETGVEISGVSVAKRDLRERAWIATPGRWEVIILIGIEEFERARESYLWKIQRSKEGATAIFGKSKDPGSDEAAIFGKSKDNAVKPWIFQSQSLENPKMHQYEIYNEIIDAAAAAAPTSTPKEKNWKQERVDQQFLDELVTRGLFSAEVVKQSWQELAFTIAQRGPEAVATKGELMGFCRAKQRSLQLPYDRGEVVALPKKATPPRRDLDCPQTCELCHGTQLEVVEGKGARRCPNKAERLRQAGGA